jgi:hypothetical protein
MRGVSGESLVAEVRAADVAYRRVDSDDDSHV